MKCKSRNLFKTKTILNSELLVNKNLIHNNKYHKNFIRAVDKENNIYTLDYYNYFFNISTKKSKTLGNTVPLNFYYYKNKQNLLLKYKSKKIPFISTDRFLKKNIFLLKENQEFMIE